MEISPQGLLWSLAAIIALAWISAAVQLPGLLHLQVARRVPVWLQVTSECSLLLPALGWLAITLRSQKNQRSFAILALFCSVLIIAYAKLPSPFFEYVWDVFLVESVFVTIASVILLEDPRTEKYYFWPIRLLLFKLMFSMGVIKFMYGMPEWKSGLALKLFWANQPMPGYLAWFAAQLPDWVQKSMVFFVFLVEIPGPFLIFAGPRARILYFFMNLLLQLGIFFSGNYGFFNLLTIVVSLSLFEPKIVSQNTSRMVRGAALWLRYLGFVVIFSWLITSAWHVYRVVFFETGYLAEYSWILRELPQQSEVPAPLRVLLKLFARARYSNPYALFAHIPRYRMEIVLQGSQDGKDWKVYPFRVKPQDLHTAPIWYAPHHWRLDHQFYYESFRIRDPQLHARFSDFLGARWTPKLIQAISVNDHAVLSLFRANPFPDSPPLFFRFVYQYYEFSTSSEKEKDGTYWRTISPHTGQFFEGIFTARDANQLP